MADHNDYLELNECVERRVYELQSRNLKYGIFDGKKGFIGIRTKLKSRFLFTEYHWDSLPITVATAKPIKDLDICVPSAISLNEILQTIDKDTGREIEWVASKGWMYTDTGETSHSINALAVSNQDLFDWLENNCP